MVKDKNSKFDRHFHWMSSVNGDESILSALNQKMAWFYSQIESRGTYQAMLDKIDKQQESQPDEGSVNHQMINYICQLQPENVLEVGCGNGRLYRQLCKYDYKGNYAGIEVADYIIKQNIQQHPQATWKCGTAYEIPFSSEFFEVGFCFYVLEHLVYPEQGIKEMLRVIKPGGRVILVFPDFAETGRFPSQQLGFSIGNAREKLCRGRVIDTLVSLYDSRVRLPRALKNTVANIGPFPVNIRPLCLSYPSVMDADVDAIYIASKTEIADWATTNGYQVEYPCGTAGIFANNAFMVIKK